MKTKIFGFALPFHLQKSKSHETLVVEPLSRWCTFSFSAWDGTTLSDIPSKGILLFFQYPPPDYITNNPRYKIVWIPMWDHIKKYTDSFWRTIPKTVRVVAFSDAVAKISRAANLPTLRLQFYPDTKDMPKVVWDREKILFYWNRAGLIGTDDLAKLCAVLHIKKLYFQNQLDPGLVRTLDYRLPDTLGKTDVVHLPIHLSSSRYNEILDQANIYIAPRTYEGVGLSFINALSRGCFVLGHYAPTMNEYITHNRDGFLFDLKEKYSLHSLISNAIAVRIPKLLGGRDYQNHLNLDWKSLADINLTEVGEKAWERARIGYEAWTDNLRSYADYVTTW